MAKATRPHPVAILPAFAHHLEEPLEIATQLLTGLAMIAETMPEKYGLVVQRMAWLALEHVGTAECMRMDALQRWMDRCVTREE